jgi:hypothetical protein
MKTESSNRNQEMLNSKVISKTTSPPPAWISSILHSFHSRFVYFVIALFLLFYCDFLRAKAIPVGHPVKKGLHGGLREG